MPCRGVVSDIGTAGYRLGGYVANVIQFLDEKAPSYITDSRSLRKMLAELSIDANDRLASFDIEKMYPSIQREKALECLRRRATEHEGELWERHKITVSNLLILATAVLPTEFILLDGTIIEQLEGCPIGKSISGPLAGIYMSFWESEFLANNQFRFKLWKRMRDDILIVGNYNGEEIHNCVQVMNKQDRRIQFTFELESDGYLPFMDLGIHRKDDGFTTTVYRKPTHTDVYIHRRSHHPTTIKEGTMKTLACRAHALCEPQECQDELNYLIDVFESNGYSRQRAKEVITTYKPGSTKREQWPHRLHVPYFDRGGEKLQRDMLKLNIETSFKKGKSLRGMLCKLKLPRDNKTMTTAEVVYEIPCQDCSMTYVGETCRELQTRIKEHETDIKRANEKSGPFMHTRMYRHRVDLKNVKIIAQEPNWSARKRLEAVFIAARSRADQNGVMNQDSGRTIHNIWDGLLRFIKKKKSRCCDGQSITPRPLPTDALSRLRPRVNLEDDVGVKRQHRRA